MAITSFAQLLTEMAPAVPVVKAGAPITSTTWRNWWYSAGMPAPASANAAGLGGAALTSAVGQLPIPNPAAGNTYLTGVNLNIMSSGAPQTGVILLCDRLWENSGLNVTLTTAQTVNSVPWPARDSNGSTNGEGVFIGLEVSATTGSGTPAFSMSYTNQAGAAGKTASGFLAATGATSNGVFYPMTLAAGDTGVRSLQNFTLSASMTSGSIALVAFRPLCMIPFPSGAGANSGTILSLVEDALTLAMPRIFDNSVLFPMMLTPSGSATPLAGTFQYAQG